MLIFRSTNSICSFLWLDRVIGGVTYEFGGVAGGEGEDVGAGDGAGAGGLEGGLDLVDDLEPPEGVAIGVGILLADYAAAVVQQHGCVAPLHTETCWKNGWLKDQAHGNST